MATVSFIGVDKLCPCRSLLTLIYSSGLTLICPQATCFGMSIQQLELAGGIAGCHDIAFLPVKDELPTSSQNQFQGLPSLWRGSIPTGSGRQNQVCLKFCSSWWEGRVHRTVPSTELSWVWQMPVWESSCHSLLLAVPSTGYPILEIICLNCLPGTKICSAFISMTISLAPCRSGPCAQTGQIWKSIDSDLWQSGTNQVWSRRFSLWHLITAPLS